MIEQFKSIIFGILSDKPIAYHPDIAKMLKSTTACIFLSQLLYWLGRGHDNEWIYKTQDEWYKETGLTRKEQETARKKLRDAGILIEARRGQPARLYYQIDFERLAECLREYYDKLRNSDPNPPKPSNIKDEREHSRMPERGNLECPKGANLNARKSHSIYTENTTENTTYVVDVVEPPAEKCQTDIVLENPTAGEPEDNNIKELQEQAEKACGVRLPTELLENLTKKYGQEKVKEKMRMLGSVRTRNAPGFLIAALRDDYVLRPGQPQQQKRASPAGQAGRGKAPPRSPDNPENELKKNMIRKLLS